MAPQPDVLRYLPTRDAARALGFHLAPAFEERRLAALVVDARVVRRTSWSEQKVLRADDAAKLREAPPPEPRPGAMYHHVLDEVPVPGTGLVRCQVRHYHDEERRLVDCFVPSAVMVDDEVSHFGAALRAVALGGPRPEALRCSDFAPHAGGSAYRSAPTTRPPDFHGFDYGDALERAATAVGDLFGRGTVLGGQVHVHAWPFLWLRYGELEPAPDVVLVCDASGALHAVGGQLR